MSGAVSWRSCTSVPYTPTRPMLAPGFVTTPAGVRTGQCARFFAKDAEAAQDARVTALQRYKRAVC